MCHLLPHAFLALVMIGCANPRPVNPSFDVTATQASAVLKEMKSDRKPLQRPLVIVGGFLDPGLGAFMIRSRLEPVFGDEMILDVVTGYSPTFDAARRQLIDAVQKRFPSDDPQWTVEVDVIGISMGGVTARYASIEHPKDPHARRLRVKRLFTLGSPHQGAQLAVLPAILSTHADMRINSEFLSRLNEASVDYPIIPYTRLGDIIVGAPYTAPPGQTPLWLARPIFDPPHMGMVWDPRILADIARHLRDEKPLQSADPAPLPGG